MYFQTVPHLRQRSLRMSATTVLLVEDNPDNRDIYGTFLRHYGFTVVEAGDGEEGVRLAREFLPGVVLMDVGLPLLDGLEATRRLKADPATADIPVIALTAHAMESDRQAASTRGATPTSPSRRSPAACWRWCAR
jgi:CheY-like chemotaxis protein